MHGSSRSEAREAAPAWELALRILEGDQADRGREIPLSAFPVVVGRGEDCDARLNDQSTSRRHVRIEKDGAGFRLVDLGSSNGLWVADQRVGEAQLAAGATFRIGGTLMELVTPLAAIRSSDPMDLEETSVLSAHQVKAALAAVHRRALEEEGDEVALGANRPFLLDAPGNAWYIVSGRVEVFTVAVEGGKPAGARTHFLTLDEGDCLFGMDLARFGLGSGFLAVGKAGTLLRRIPVERLRELAADGHHEERIADLLDGWIAALSESVVRDIPPGTPEVSLEAGKPASLAAGQRARSAQGVVWIQGASNLLFLGMSDLPPAPLFPLSEHGWIEAVGGEGSAVGLQPTGSAGQLSGFAVWQGLEAFHEALCQCEFLNKKLSTVDEFNRLRSKEKYSVAALDAAYGDVGAVLAFPEQRPPELLPDDDVDPLFRACRLIGERLGFEVKDHPQARDRKTLEERLAVFANASLFRTRSVALRGDWWKNDHGPLLAQYEDTRSPVALLPRSPTSYELVDPKTSRREPVTPEVAAKLSPFATTFYRPFPPEALGVRQLIAFGARGLRKDIWTLLAMGVALGLLGTLVPYFTGQVFDTAIPQSERGLLAQFAFALVATALATSAFKITQSIAVLRLQGTMDYSIQSALWDRLLNLPSTFFRKYPAGDLADRAQGIDTIRGLIAGAGISAILGSVSSLFYIGLMATYNGMLTLLALGLTVLFVTVTTTVNYLQLRIQRDQFQLRGRISGLVLQLISGVAKIRVSGAENHAFRVWAREFSEQRRMSLRISRWQNVLSTFNSVFPILSSMAIFFLLVRLQSAAAAEGEAGASLSTGEFIGFNTAYLLFLAAMQALSDASLNLLKVVPIYERLKPILLTEPEVDETRADPGELRGEINLSHIHFRYTEDGPWVLKDVSLKIRPGEMIAFVGSSGCGKSTLMRLMLGFETPERGAIYYDGQDLQTLDLRQVRQQMGVVLQDSRVLPADVFRNIVGSGSRTVEDAWEAARMSGLADDVQQMPMGMHTYIPEGGSGLSGGQKQRLLIARALVNRPKILFLDEATSALDNRTQATVTESMERLKSTRIVIAHRLSTIVNADRICYLEAGEIREMGTYQELMERKGLFAELAQRQLA